MNDLHGGPIQAFKVPYAQPSQLVLLSIRRLRSAVDVAKSAKKLIERRHSLLVVFVVTTAVIEKSMGLPFVPNQRALVAGVGHRFGEDLDRRIRHRRVALAMKDNRRRPAG